MAADSRPTSDDASFQSYQIRVRVRALARGPDTNKSQRPFFTFDAFMHMEEPVIDQSSADLHRGPAADRRRRWQDQCTQTWYWGTNGAWSVHGCHLLAPHRFVPDRLCLICRASPPPAACCCVHQARQFSAFTDVIHLDFDHHRPQSAGLSNEGPSPAACCLLTR